MKKTILILFSLFLLAGPIFAQTESSSEKIEWMSFEEAMVRNQGRGKKIFIDIYTSWCGWCKKMDAGTFTNPAVIREMNRNFLAVKLDAQQKADIQVGDTTYVYEQRGSQGYHQLAVALLNGKLKFPTCVVLDESFNMLQPLPGFYSAEELRPILKFLGDNIYQHTPFEDFKAREAAGGGE